MIAGERLAYRGHSHAVDGYRRRAIGRLVGEAARGKLAVAGCVAAACKASLIDQRTVATRSRHLHGNRTVGDGDDEIGRRRIAVAIGDRVAEGVGDTAFGARIPGVGVAAVGRDGQRAIFALDRVARTARTVRAGEGGDSRAVGTLRIVDKYIAADRAVFAGRDGIGIVSGCGHIVDDADHEGRLCRVAIAVGNDESEAVAVRIGQRIVAQLVGVAVFAIDEGDGQDAAISGDSAAVGHVDAVDDERTDRIAAGADIDRAAGKFAVARRIRTGRFAIASTERFLEDGLLAIGANLRCGIGLERDGYRGGRGVPVAIGDGVVESDRAFFARSGRVGEGAVAIIRKAAVARERVVDHCDAGRKIYAVGAGRVIIEGIDRDRSVLADLRRDIVHRFRRVVDDRDDQVVIGNIAVEIGHDDGDRNGRAVRIAGVVGQLVFVGDRADAGFRIVGIIDDRQRAGIVGDDDLRQIARIDHRSADRDRSNAIGRNEGDRAGDGFVIAIEVGTRRFVVTGSRRRRKLPFVDNGNTGTARNFGDCVGRVADINCQGGGAGAAIGIDDGIIELFADPARRVEEADIGVGSVRIERQFAIGADERLARIRTAAVVAEAADCTAWRVSVRARFVIDEDIAGDRAESSGLDSAGIVARDRCIVDDSDIKCRIGSVAVGIDHSDDEGVVASAADHIVFQRVAEPDFAGFEVNAGDREHPAIAFDGLADVGHLHAVDQNRIDTIGRIDDNGAGDGFGIGFRACTFGLANAVDAPGRKAVFIDACNRVDDADRIVRRLDDDRRLLIGEIGDDFALFRLGEEKLRVRKQVADRVGGLDVAGIDFEIAARTLRIAGSRLRLVAGQEGGKVGRRNRDAVEDDLRHDDRAFGNDDASAVGEREDEIASFGAQSVEHGAFGQDHDTVCIGLENDSAARNGPRRAVRRLHPVFERSAAILGIGEFVARLEAIHVFRPC